MIRDCVDTDLPKLVSLLRSLNMLHVQHLPHRFHDEARDPELLSFFQARQAKGARILAYFTEGLPRGYLMWEVEHRDMTCVTLARHQAVLDHIYVEPGWRRRGIGRRLITRFEAECAQVPCKEWISRVHSFNDASNALMRGAGAGVGLRVYQKRLA